MLTTILMYIMYISLLCYVHYFIISVKLNLGNCPQKRCIQHS